MRHRQFRPCLDGLPSRIAPSTVALAGSPTAQVAPVAPPACPTPDCCSENPMDGSGPTSSAG